MPAMDRQATLSIIKGAGAKIVKHIRLTDFLERISSSDELLAKGQAIRQAAGSDQGKYEILKARQFGFIIGDFSYRDMQSCQEYFPLLGFDIDHVGDAERARRIEKALRAWPFSYAVMPSLSWKGIRVLVWCDCTQEQHGDFYEVLADRISEIAQLPTKSTVRQALISIGWDKSAISDYLKKHPHVDDATSDISRFWFFSGVPRENLYWNRQSKVFTREEVGREVARRPSTRRMTGGTFTEAEKMEALLDMIERDGTDITPGVTEWFKIGVAVALEFGEAGRSYFHRLCQFHPDYKPRESDREYDRCLVKRHARGGSVTIASVYYLAEQFGTKLDFKALAKKMGRPYTPPKEETRDNRLELAERSIISFCLLHGDEVDVIFDVYPQFSKACFLGSMERELFGAILQMRSHDMDIDKISLSAFTGYSLALLSKYDEVASDHIATLCKMVYNAFTLRRIDQLTDQVRAETRKRAADAATILEATIKKARQLQDQDNRDSERKLSASLAETVDEIQQVQKRILEGGSMLTGVPSGLKQEDKLTGGYQRGDLIILGARPGMGKTAKMLTTALEASRCGFPVGIFSMEMSHRDLSRRMISSEACFDISRLRKGEFLGNDAEHINNVISSIAELDVWIEDRPSASIDFIERRTSRWIARHDVRIVIIDYLQLITYSGQFKGNPVRQVTEIADRLKAMAKRHDIPVIALAQLSRAVETRGGSKRPQLSDLRDSGGIEQAADVVSFLYRPEYYDITEDENGRSLKRVAEVIYAKHRNGPRKTMTCAFDGKYMRFTDGEYEPETIDLKLKPF